MNPDLRAELTRDLRTLRALGMSDGTVCYGEGDRIEVRAADGTVKGAFSLAEFDRTTFDTTPDRWTRRAKR